MAIDADNLDSLVDACKGPIARFEGSAPWMYQDQAGDLAIGTAHVLAEDGDDLWAIREAIRGLMPYDGGPRALCESAWVSLDRFGLHCGRRPGPTWDTVHQLMLTADAESAEPQTYVDSAPGTWGVDYTQGRSGVGGGDAMLDVMVAEGRRILQLPFGGGLAAEFFRSYNSFALTATGANELFADDVEDMVAQLQGEIPPAGSGQGSMRQKAFDPLEQYPLEIQMVLVDLGYQMGVMDLFMENAGIFVQVVRAGEWRRAYQFCPMPASTTPARRTWRQRLLARAIEAAAREEAARKKAEKKVEIKKELGKPEGKEGELLKAKLPQGKVAAEVRKIEMKEKQIKQIEVKKLEIKKPELKKFEIKKPELKPEKLIPKNVIPPGKR